MKTPSRDEVLRVAGEPVAWRGMPSPLYAEANLLAVAAAYMAAGQESAKADGWRQCAAGQHTSQFCGQAEKARAAGAEDMRGRAANTLKLSSADLLLMAGEMTTQELRTVRAVLNALEKNVRALPITPTNTEG